MAVDKGLQNMEAAELSGVPVGIGLYTSPDENIGMITPPQLEGTISADPKIFDEKIRLIKARSDLLLMAWELNISRMDIIKDGGIFPRNRIGYSAPETRLFSAGKTQYSIT